MAADTDMPDIERLSERTGALMAIVRAAKNTYGAKCVVDSCRMLYKR